MLCRYLAVFTLLVCVQAAVTRVQVDDNQQLTSDTAPIQPWSVCYTYITTILVTVQPDEVTIQPEEDGTLPGGRIPPKSSGGNSFQAGGISTELLSTSKGADTRISSEPLSISGETLQSHSTRNDGSTDLNSPSGESPTETATETSDPIVPSTAIGQTIGGELNSQDISSLRPRPLATNTVFGTVAGTSSIPPNGEIPGTVVVTVVPILTTGTVAGTSTIEASGDNRGGLIITVVPSTVIGSIAGTSTFQGSGTKPPSVIVTVAPGGTSIVIGPVAGTSTAPDGAVVQTVVPTTVTGLIGGTMTIAASGSNSAAIIVTVTPGSTATSIVEGPVAGSSVIPASGSIEATVIITLVPVTITGSAAGTTTVPPSGGNAGGVTVTIVHQTFTGSVAGTTTSSGVVIVTVNPGTVPTSIVTGPVLGTTTIPASGTNPGSVIITVTSDANDTESGVTATIESRTVSNEQPTGGLTSQRGQTEGGDSSSQAVSTFSSESVNSNTGSDGLSGESLTSQTTSTLSFLSIDPGTSSATQSVDGDVNSQSPPNSSLGQPSAESTRTILSTAVSATAINGSISDSPSSTASDDTTNIASTTTAGFVSQSLPPQSGGAEISSTSSMESTEAANSPTSSVTGTITPVMTPTSSRSTLSASSISTVILGVEFQITNTTRKRDMRLSKRDDPSNFVGNETISNPSNCSEASVYRQSAGELVARTGIKSLSVDPGIPYISMANYSGGIISTSKSFQIYNLMKGRRDANNTSTPSFHCSE